MSRRNSTARCAALALTLAVFAGSGHAFATDIWTAPYPGVRWMHRTGGGVDVHVLVVDLSNPDVSLIATRPADRLITTSEFARRYEADIAINANFFDRNSCGVMVGDGEAMDNYDDWCGASMAFGRNNEAAVFDSLAAQNGPLPASWMTEVLSGKPFLMRDGRALTNWSRPQHLYRPNPRTALGLTADRHTLVILIADGRRGPVPGLTGFEMVQLFREFDVSDAVNLDGGGSTELVLGGEIRNHPADHRERVVLSHLGIRIHSGARWVAGAIEGYGGAAHAAEGSIANVWVEARNLGRETWRAGCADARAPVLELDDGLVSYMASVKSETPPGGVGRFEIAWLVRGAGARGLHARLRAPDGTYLDDGSLAWSIDVDPNERAPSLLPQRVTGIAQASQITLPAGLGALYVGTHGCNAAPTRRDGRGFAAVMAAMVMVGMRRRRRDSSTVFKVRRRSSNRTP